jgi:cation diffusion facilitator CzcD-associated flavoprotein CzcO
MGPDLTPTAVGIIGAGAAGLITAHVLLQDGFDVQVITRDMSAGGVWAKTRVYPGLNINKYVYPILKCCVL